MRRDARNDSQILYAEVPTAFAHADGMEVQVAHSIRRRPKKTGQRVCTVLSGVLVSLLVLGGIAAVVWWVCFREGAPVSRQPEFLGHLVVYPTELTGSVFSAGNGSRVLAEWTLGRGGASGMVFSRECSLGKEQGNATRPGLLNDERFRYICLEYSRSRSTLAAPSHRLLIQKSNLSADAACYDIHWDALTPSTTSETLQDCLFPSPATPGILGPARLPEGDTLTLPYWILATGVILVGRDEDDGVPGSLEAAVNASGVCVGGAGPRRWYTLCVGRPEEDVVALHRVVLPRVQALYEHDFDSGVKGQLDESVIRRPIWNTMSVGGDASAQLDAGLIADLARLLTVDLQLPVSQLLVDPRWEGVLALGEDTLDPVTFPVPPALYLELQALNISLQLSLHPFITSNSALFANLSNSGLLVGDRRQYKVTDAWYWMTLPGEVNLVQTAMLDLTLQAAVDWKKARVRSLMKTLQGRELPDSRSGSCRFLGGWTGWLRPSPPTAAPSRRLLAAFPAAVRHICGDNVQLSIPPLSGSFGLLRLPDTPLTNSPSMSAADTLHSIITGLIPTALRTSLTGHPLFIAPMVGGNPFLTPDHLLDFGPDAEARYPPGERFLRFLGVVLFFPVLEFGVNPAYYSDDLSVLENTLTLLSLREKYLEVILSAARESWIDPRVPVVRPVWWEWPGDPRAWRVEDQYLVGAGMLVAPIIEKGATSRRVYLPEGQWVNAQGGRERAGVVEVTAGLDTVPVFFRVV